MSDCVLVVGSDGMIGGALFNYLKSHSENVLGTTRRSYKLSESRLWLDVKQDPDSWDIPTGIRIAIVCVGAGGLSDCQDNPGLTAAINVSATFTLAEQLVQNGVQVVLLSSDRVFDGSKPLRRTDDRPCPVTEYGNQKAELERRVLQLGEKATVLRMTKVFSVPNSRIVSWAHSLAHSERIHVPSDLPVAPVLLNDAVRLLYSLVLRPSPGIFHLSGNRDVMMADIAVRLAEQLNKGKDLVHTTPSRNLGIPSTYVPSHTTLDMLESTRLLGIQQPSTERAVRVAITHTFE